MWMHQMCRLCAQVSEVLFPIFEKEGERPRLDIKIRKCLSLLISEEDCKPKHICYNCTSKLEDYYEFLELCQSSDYKFESILYATNTSESNKKWDVDKMNSTSEQLTLNPSLSGAHEGVIVVGKMDETQNINRECQDILLMVELKYKGVDMDPQSTTELVKQNKLLYQQNDLLHDKQVGVFPHSVLRHSDDFRKNFQKNSNETSTHINHLDTVTYPEAQDFVEQPIELIKTTTFANPLQLNNKIMKTSPMKTKPYPCTHCSKSFMRRSNLNAHMSVHTQVRPFQCEVCDRSFALRWNLTVHQRLHNGTYSCEFCGKAFPVKGKLERHRRTHTGERPFACHVANCEKAFADKRNLEAHIRIHSEDRPFVCGICARGFRSRSHLSDHRRVHSAEAPFTCDSCGKSFKWKTNLTIHLKNHTGEKSVCQQCGKQFGRTTQLYKHKKIHHSHAISTSPTTTAAAATAAIATLTTTTTTTNTSQANKDIKRQ